MCFPHTASSTARMQLRAGSVMMFTWKIQKKGGIYSHWLLLTLQTTEIFLKKTHDFPAKICHRKDSD